MPFIITRSLQMAAVTVSLAALSACGSMRTGGDKALGVLTPYKIDIVQGNVVTREQLAVLRVGMPRAMVQDVLGTPLLTSVFHADRWDYVFTLKRQGGEPQARTVTLFFANDTISRIEADELPSETEFVSTLRSKVITKPGPALIASEEALKKFPPPQRTEGAATPGSTGTVTVYPPLEPSGL
jgi:outer membrane protein assembly factor BamE